MAVETYGRNRQSIADLEQELYSIFEDHPRAHINETGDPVIPADALVDVLRAFSRNHDSVDLMTREEEDQLTLLIESNPGLAVTPQVLLQFIAMRTNQSPDDSSPEEDFAFPERGRSEDRDYDGPYSRSSSQDSSGTSVWRSSSRPNSRPPSRGPPVPSTPTRDSPFDASRRQRSTPLANAHNAPSSWTRRPPPSRRRSDASQHGRTLSDSEVRPMRPLMHAAANELCSQSAAPPSAFGRTPGRSRAPSNPISPSSSVGSPPSAASISRPHSRAQSQPQSHFSSMDQAFGDYHRTSPERETDFQRQPQSSSGLISPPPSDLSDSYDEDQFADTINSLLMPRASADSDSDDDDASAMGLIMDRSAASSTISLDFEQRIEALQRVNTELARKLVDAERTLQVKLAEHESELEEMESRLEEVRSELSATKREEKELRSKERTNQTQISALESEIAKLQKSLETARASYQSLQKQYQEQCAESERYRNTLRRRDEEIKDYKEAASLQQIEAAKWAREQANYEERIAFIESELSVAQQAQAQLDEQKQENMMLKETIDRMRFDMDEMRNSASSNANQGGSGAASVRGSVSRSLGAELLSKMKDLKDDVELEEEEEVADESIVSPGVEDHDTEGEEDLVETIITTRTKRRVASRAKRPESIQVDEVKEYSDTGVQHEMDEFSASHYVQTDPAPKVLTASFSVQTEERPLASMDIQTDPEPEPEPELREMVSMEVQTDESEPAPLNALGLELDVDSMASSSSTLLPPTPKQKAEDLHDLPPDYHQVTSAQEREEFAMRVAEETVKQWHQGLTLPIEALPGGVSEDAAEDWKALKEELGVQCSVIDRLVEESQRNGAARRDSERAGRRKSGRFYNIYNTYVYGGDSEGSSVLSASQLLFCVGVSAAVAFVVGQATAPQYAIPGGLTPYDRAAWSSFNSIRATGEGFPGDGAAVWDFIGRVGGGAVRTLRGWPM
ncbi:hypothetical protein DAEQUDRAFT_391530 [Daedalea quercina L-15889]|uniref:Uncharacterized protein n=1 Tax=Daedalea quercina L-15889 TaxID=1314783 RepID=A0A165NVJ7_9APHY|nr:hypothetical protein DAEQUDRAFT_391530 [Daedalea quercina L-15889]